MNGMDIIKDFKEIRKKVGYMPGKFSLYQYLTVLENLTFFATIFNTTIEENYDLIKEIYIQSEPCKDRRAGKLSREFKQKLEKSIKNNKPLKIKLGIDPTGSDLHIGHAVPLRKLKQFQDLGHTVQFLIGTFTARIGDPTGKSETRKMLSNDAVQENIKTYIDQLGIILNLEKTEIKYNGDWLEKLSLEEVSNLLSQFTVSQIVSREYFSKRLT